MRSSTARKLTAHPAARPRAFAGESIPGPKRSPSPSAAAPPSAPRRQLILAVVVGILVAISVIGAGYYAAPMAVRVRHPLHDMLRPSGLVGQGAGVLAFAIFTFLWLYPLRKRVKALAWTGSVGRWLDVHVTAALTLPLLLAIHAAWKFEGVIGLGYAAILVVCASGVIGRYLYTRIPRARSGVELTLDEVAAQRAALIARIAAATGLEPARVASTLTIPGSASGRLTIGRAMLQLIAGDVLRWRRVRVLRKRWSVMAPAGRRPSSHALDEAVRLASRELALDQQVRVLDTTHRVFRWWHVAHRPIALTALVTVIVHVIVVVAVGATWLG